MPISGKEMLKLYLTYGWRILRQNGSHVIVALGDSRETIPIHANKDLKKGLEQKLLKRLKKSRSK